MKTFVVNFGDYLLSMWQNRQMSCQYVAESIISEITYSRFFFCKRMRISFFRSWMSSNNVNLKLLLIFGHIWKNLVWLLRFGFGLLTLYFRLKILASI
jgi:hypothetical protein